MKVIKSKSYLKAVKQAGMFDGVPGFDKKVEPAPIQPQKKPKRPQSYVYNPFGGRDQSYNISNRSRADYDPATDSTSLQVLQMDKQIAQQIHAKVAEYYKLEQNPAYRQALSTIEAYQDRLAEDDSDMTEPPEVQAAYQLRKQTREETQRLEREIIELQSKQKEIKLHKFKMKGDYANMYQHQYNGKGGYDTSKYHFDEPDPTWEKLP